MRLSFNLSTEAFARRGHNEINPLAELRPSISQNAGNIDGPWVSCRLSNDFSVFLEVRVTWLLDAANSRVVTFLRTASPTAAIRWGLCFWDQRLPSPSPHSLWGEGRGERQQKKMREGQLLLATATAAMRLGRCLPQHRFFSLTRVSACLDLLHGK